MLTFQILEYNDLIKWKNCKAVPKKKLSLSKKLNNAKLGFQSHARIFVSENLTRYSQHLAWKYRELKQAGKIHNYWSAKGVVKFRRTMKSVQLQWLLTLTLLLYTLILFSKWGTRSGWVGFQRENKIRVSWSGCFAFHSLIN